MAADRAPAGPRIVVPRWLRSGPGRTAVEAAARRHPASARAERPDREPAVEGEGRVPSPDGPR